MSVESSALDVGRSAPRGAVFLSYASQDADAAKRICDALRGAGVEVWFDAEGGLEHGDEWDAKIRRQIKECVLFIPVISANTQAREEGYFRLEWELAAQRALSIASGVAFILPVVIDGTKEPAALVPDRFRTVQWTKLPNGVVPPEVLQRFLKLWSHRTGALKALEAGRPRPAAEQGEGTLPPVNQPRRWVPVLAGVGVLAAVAAGWFLLRPAPAPTSANVAASEPVTAKSPAEWPRDPELRRAYQLSNQINSIREDLLLAEEMAKKAVEKSPSDPEAVAVLAHIESTILLRNFDFTADRTAIARRYCERAVQLAPDNPVALGALAVFLTQRGGDHPRAEELLRRASTLDPTEPRYARNLALVVGRQNGAAGTAAAMKLLEEAVARFPQDALVHYNLGIQYRDGGDYENAERLFDAAIALAPIANAIDWKARFALMRGDLPGMKAWLDRVPARLQAEERSVLTRLAYALFSGEVDYGLNAVNKYAEPWFFDISNYTGPRSLLLGALRERQGNADLARTHYEAALTEIRRYREEHPADPGTHAAEAWALLGLGRLEEARAAHRVSVAGAPRPTRFFAGGLWWFFAHARVFLLEDRAKVLTMLREMAEQPEVREPLLRRIRMDPRLAAFHHDPEIVAILAPPAAPAKAAAPDEKSVAVLAFANLSTDKDNEYFSDGISEELLNVLAKVPGLKVSARTSAFFFKGKDIPIPEIAQKLGVAYVVEGSVRKSGEKVRITAQLIKAADGFHVWSDTFTRDLKDVFAVQDEIAGLIAKNLQLKLADTVGSVRTDDPEAHQLYLRGRFHLNQFNLENVQRGIELFQQAVQRDPNFAAAWAGLSQAASVQGGYGTTSTMVAEGFRLARQAAERAIALDPKLPAGYLGLLSVQLSHDFDLKAAAESLRRAQALAPDDAAVLAYGARTVYALGRRADAVTMFAKAVDLDPVNPAVRSEYGFALQSLGRFAEADAQFRRLMELNAAAPWGHGGLALNYLLQGRLDEAAREAALEPTDWVRVFAVSLVQWARGKKSESDATLRELIDRFGGVAAFQVAEAYAFRRDADHTFEWLDRALRQRDPGLTWCASDPFFNSLRSDPRWPLFLQKLGFAESEAR